MKNSVQSRLKCLPDTHVSVFKNKEFGENIQVSKMLEHNASSALALRMSPMLSVITTNATLISRKMRFFFPHQSPNTVAVYLDT